MAFIRFVVEVLLIILCMQSCIKVDSTVVNVLDFGAKSDGTTDSTDAFQRAWNTVCGSTKQATLLVPKGSFLVKEIKFNGPCKNGPLILTVTIDGVIVAPDFTAFALNAKIWIEFANVTGLVIQGVGVLDGRGKTLWDCKASRGRTCPKGVDASLQISNCDHVNVIGLTSKDSEFFHIHVSNSSNVGLERLTVTAPGNSPNTDGIHVSHSDNVHILGSNIATGDDCVSIGPGTTNLNIENVNCGPGHGISIGSLGKEAGEAGVQNVTVTSCTFTRTQNGLRIKTWPRLNAGFVNQVTYQHIIMNDVQNPILIDQHYCDGQAQTCPGQGSGVKISNVSYIDVHGTSPTPLTVNFNCSQANPCRGLFMETINLKGEASCANAFGTSSGTVVPRPSCLINTQQEEIQYILPALDYQNIYA